MHTIRPPTGDKPEYLFLIISIMKEGLINPSFYICLTGVYYTNFGSIPIRQQIKEKVMKNQVTNKRGLIIEVGKNYFYYNIGLGEIKTHYVKRIESLWAVDSNGRVELDSLFESQEDVFKNRLKMKNYTSKEIQTITQNMNRFGGGFIKALAEAITRADEQNVKRLQSVFPEEFEKYLNW